MFCVKSGTNYIMECEVCGSRNLKVGKSNTGLYEGVLMKIVEYHCQDCKHRDWEVLNLDTGDKITHTLNENTLYTV